MHDVKNVLLESAKALRRALARTLAGGKRENPADRFAALSNKEIFTKIYSEGYWSGTRSGSAGGQFFSGRGTHAEAIVEPYVAAMQEFLGRFQCPPSVLDLGCGDFTLGARLRPLAGRYIAADVVEALIEHHREAFSDLDVDFRVLDLAEDPLPPADVLILRQVLQHLSNGDIAKFLPKLSGRFRWLVCTEHLPSVRDFTPNIDKPAGPTIRTRLDSGVVLTAPPFDLKPLAEQVLTSYEDEKGRVETRAYRLEIDEA